MFFNFQQALVKPGTKVVDESRPTITLTPSYNTFRLNKNARNQVLSGEAGGNGRVLLFDMASKHPDVAEDQRFYICEGFVGDDGVDVGAKLAKDTNTFSYSGVYGAMLANNNEVVNITPAGLIAMDLLYPREEGDGVNQFSAKFSKVGILIPYNNGEPVEVYNGVYRKMYAITSFESTPHTKREMSKKEYLSDTAAEAADLFDDDQN